MGKQGQAILLLRAVADMLGRKVVLDAEPHQMRRAVGHADAEPRLMPFVPQASGMRLEPRAFGRQVGSGAGAGEEFGAQSRLERRDAGRDGGLRDPHPFRRTVEAAGFAKVEEGVELVDLHGGFRAWA